VRVSFFGGRIVVKGIDTAAVARGSSSVGLLSNVAVTF